MCEGSQFQIEGPATENAVLCWLVLYWSKAQRSGHPMLSARGHCCKC